MAIITHIGGQFPPPAWRSALAGDGYNVDWDSRGQITSLQVLSGEPVPDTFSASNGITSTGASSHNDSWVHSSVGYYWFNRIHVIPAYFDVGNVVGDQKYTFSLWNAFGEAKDLVELTSSGLDGIDLNGDKMSGILNPYEEAVYTLDIYTDGPPVIDAEITWNFSDTTIAGIQATIVGRRLLLWPFMPQWPVEEGFQWETEVLRTYSKVTRTALLETPRKSLSFTYQLTKEQQEEAQRLARTWGYRPFGVPDFTQYQEIGAVAEGATVLYFDTSLMDVAVGNLITIYEDWLTVEIVQVDTVQADHVTLTKGTTTSYSNAAVCPVFSGDARRGFQFKQDLSGVAITTAEFLASWSNDLTYTESDDHHGVALYPYQNESAGRVNEGSKWAVEVVDAGIGIPNIRAAEETPVYRSEISYTAQSQEELKNLKSWLHNRSGRRRAFALPSGLADYDLAGPIANGSNSLTLSGQAFGQMYEKGALRMVLTDGTVYDLTVTSVSVQDNQTGLTVSQTFDRDVYPEDVERISLVRKMVLATDKVKIMHDADGRRFSVKVEEVPW